MAVAVAVCSSNVITHAYPELFAHTRSRLLSVLPDALVRLWLPRPSASRMQLVPWRFEEPLHSVPVPLWRVHRLAAPPPPQAQSSGAVGLGESPDEEVQYHAVTWNKYEYCVQCSAWGCSGVARDLVLTAGGGGLD
jgi:hypothetical protein